MSEFKDGDRIVYLADWDDFDGIMTYDNSRDDDSWNHKNMIRKATTEEIAAGHRIDNDMGDDSHIENHISPNCQSRDA